MTTEEIYAASIPGGAEMRAVVNQSVASSSSVNPIAAGNQAILSSKKREILYKNGYTIPGKAAALLAAEAVSGIEHSAKLGGNIAKVELKKNANWQRHTEMDAHHVVAAEAIAADIPRKLMFGVGIGINDRDNGVLLPRYATTQVATMPNASPHQHIHTALYYSNVVTAFYRVQDKKDEQQIRTLLKSIAQRLQNGQFGY
jgi:hypothetical protein